MTIDLNSIVLTVGEVIRHLPTGYYCGREVPMEVTTSSTSYYDMIGDKIFVSVNNVTQLLLGHPEILMNLSIEEFENIVRGFAYHEASHALLTPKCIQPNSRRNIFEDERIESHLQGYYMRVDFERNKRLLCDNGGVPTSMDEFFFELVRFRRGPEEFVKRVQEIIDDYPPAVIHAGITDFSPYCDRYAVYNYLNAIDELYRDYYNWLNQSSNAANASQQVQQQQQQERGQQKGQQQGGRSSSSQQSSNSSEPEDEQSGQQNDSSTEDQDSSPNPDEDQEEDNGSDSSEGDSSEGDSEDDSSEGDSEDTDSSESDSTEDDSEEGDSDSEDTDTQDGDGSDESEPSEDGDSDDCQDDSDVSEGNTDSDDHSSMPSSQRQSIKDAMSKVVNASRDTTLETEFCRIFGNVKKLQKMNGTASAGYSGRFDPRLVAMKRAHGEDDYKYHLRQAQQGSQRGYSKVHLNLWLDCSGSFEPNVAVAKEIMAALEAQERANPNFTWTLIQCGFGQRIIPKKDVHLYDAEGGTQLTPEVFEQYKKLQHPQYLNYNVVLYDGSCCGGRYWTAFDHDNVIVITDPDNTQDCTKYLHKAKLLISQNYTRDLKEQLIKLLDLVIR